MKSICDKNIKLLNSLQVRVNFFRDESSVEPLTIDEKMILKEFAEVLETSRIWWSTESPSMRSIFDQIFLEEIKKNSIKKEVVNLVTKFKSHVKLGRSNSYKALDKPLKVPLALRPCSLVERDMGLKKNQVPTINIIPPSPERKRKESNGREKQ